MKASIKKRLILFVIVLVIILAIISAAYVMKSPELAPAASSSSESEGKEYCLCSNKYDGYNVELYPGASVSEPELTPNQICDKLCKSKYNGKICTPPPCRQFTSSGYHIVSSRYI